MTRKTTTKKPSQLDRKKTGDKFVKDLISETFDQVQKDIEADERALPVLAQGVVDMAENVTDLCEAVRTDMKAVHAKLDLLLKGSDFMKEIGEKEEPWVPKVEDHVRYKNDTGVTKLGHGILKEVRTPTSWTGRVPCTVDFEACGPNTYWITDLRPATPAEVQKYEEQVKAQEWAKVDELQDWDACECTKSEQADLWAMGSTFAYHANSNSLNLRWDPDYGRTKLVKTSRPDQFSPKHPLNWIPVAEFRRRLEGTIAKRKAQEQEAKIEHWRKTTLNWPQLVKYGSRDAIVRSHHGKTERNNNNNGMGWVSLTFKEGDTNCVSPMDLTLIDP